MRTRLEERVGRAVCAWLAFVWRRPRRIAGCIIATTAVLLVYAVANLGVNMDHRRLLSERLPSQRAAREFERHFPILDDALLIVVDGDNAELARQAANALAADLASRTDRFTDVYVPGAGAFFDRHGLLYRSIDELEEVADQLAQLQPVLGELTRDASLANLARLIETGLDRLRTSEVPDEDWPSLLDQFRRATVQVYEEYPVSVSWESLLLEGSSFDPATRTVVIAHPVLDFDRILPADGAIREIRRAARELELLPERGVRVRITGNPALNHEEMLSLAWDIGFAGLFSFALVTGILYVALRSLRLVSAVALALLMGLVWTAAFAAAAVGELNLISIAFGVLFIGLGVDFGIHLSMHYAEFLHEGRPNQQALEESVRRVGSALVLCAVTTALGFFAFVPTDYRGVAELGLISGVGMFVILFQMLTLLPALLGSWLRVDHLDALPFVPNFRPALARAIEGHPRTTVLVAVLAFVFALGALPRARFDSNVVKMRNPNTESVQAFNDLLAESRTTPWYLDVLAPNLDSADRLGRRLRELPAVERTITLSDYVPGDQEEKLELLAEVALMLDLPPADDSAGGGGPSPEEQIAALRKLHDVLGRPWPSGQQLQLAESSRLVRRELGRFLEQVEREPDPAEALASLEKILLGRLPDQIERLQLALSPSPVTLANLPEELVARMRAPEGLARVQVFPSGDLNDQAELVRFVDAVRSRAPDPTGVAVQIVEFGRATAKSLAQALTLASLAIAALLWALWRRLGETLLALAPLVLAAALAGATMALLGQPFNFANVIVLPLLMGIGVDSGIHLVSRSRDPVPAHGGLSGTITARAVFYSALTTLVSFGSLAFSSHRGIASLGLLLVIGMVLVLVCNLVVLPALIALYRARDRASADVAGEPDAAELPAGFGKEEIAVGGPDVGAGGHT